jgi:hypothetical protein
MLHKLEKFAGTSKVLPSGALNAVIRKVGKTE